MQIVPILAAGSTEIWPFIVGGIFLLIKWLASKGEATPTQPSTRRPTETTTTRPPATSEEERTRRFLEALGLPPDEGAPGKRAPMPPRVSGRQSMPSMRQAPPPPPPRQPSLPPVPPIVYQQPPPRRKKQAPPPAPAPAVLSSDWLPEMHTKAEQVKVAELQVPEYHEFRTTTSEVHAIPFERIAAEAAPTKARLLSARDLRAHLRDRSSLRAAILLREILGPPPGLQTR
jgi:hypothetical protein